MNVLDITAMAISHGLMEGEAGFAFSAIPYAGVSVMANDCKSSVISVAIGPTSLHRISDLPKLIA
jgi:hypothetical protein